MTGRRKAKPVVYPVNQSVGYILHRLDTLLSTALDRSFQASGFNITSEQFGVLSKLWEGDGMHQAELSEKVNKDKHNVTRILNLLEKNGFVHRVRDTKDKRLLKVHLTRQGRSVEGMIRAIGTDVLRSAAKGLSKENIQTLKQMLQVIVTNLEALRRR